MGVRNDVGWKQCGGRGGVKVGEGPGRLLCRRQRTPHAGIELPGHIQAGTVRYNRVGCKDGPYLPKRDIKVLQTKPGSGMAM